MKGLKGAEYKAARADIEPLRQQKAKALENKNLILEKFKQAVEEYKVVKSGSAVKVSKTVAKYGTSSYDPSERKEWIKTCTAGGSCQRACAAKYKMLRLKELHEKLKAQSTDLGVQVKAEWAAMKGLKGTEYKQARLDIEPLRQKKIKTANKKRTVLIKYKQAVQEYKAVAKLPCGKNTAKIAKEKEAAKEKEVKEIAKVKSDSIDKDGLVKNWEGEGFTSEAIQAKLKIEELKAEYEEAKKDYEEAQEKVKEAWQNVKTLKTSDERAKARIGIEGLKEERSRTNKIRLDIYKQY